MPATPPRPNPSATVRTAVPTAPAPARKAATAGATSPSAGSTSAGSTAATAARKRRAAQLRVRRVTTLARAKKLFAELDKAKAPAARTAAAAPKAAVKATPKAAVKVPAAGVGQAAAVRRPATKPPVPPAKTLPHRTNR